MIAVAVIIDEEEFESGIFDFFLVRRIKLITVNNNPCRTMGFGGINGLLGVLFFRDEYKLKSLTFHPLLNPFSFLHRKNHMISRITRTLRKGKTSHDMPAPNGTRRIRTDDERF